MDIPTDPLSFERITALPLFQGISDSEYQQVRACVTHLTLEAGEVLFKAGDPFGKAAYIIERGTMSLNQPDGQTYTLGRGEMPGLPNAIDGSPYRFTATALTEVDLLKVPAEELQDVEDHCPAVADAMHRMIATRIRDSLVPRQTSSRVLNLPARSIMKSPLTVCPPEVTLHDAYQLMRARTIGSLGITDEDGKLLGLVTTAGLCEALLSRDATPDSAIISAADERPRTVEWDTPLWEVEELQHDHGVKYVVVTEGERPLGIISQTDILDTLVTNQRLILAEIEQANNLEELRDYFDRILAVARDACESNRLASAAVRGISEFHLAIQRRCVELTLGEMEKKGLGEPPAPYAFIIMGSGGRKEMMINPDQDNGLIIGDAPAENKDGVQKWFKTFAKRLNENLDAVGYTLCPGDIMARNPMFQKTLKQWKKQISHITETPNAKAARWANVFLDFDTLYGDEGLTAELRDHAFAQFRKHPRLLTMMVQDDAEGRPPLGLFNRLITEPDKADKKGKGKVDIKRNGMRIVADAARIYAFRHGIEATNTSDRLAALVRQGVLTADLVSAISAGYEELLDILLNHQISQMERGKKVDKLIAPEKLTPLQHESLRMAMRAVKLFQEELQTEFGAVTF